MLAGVHVSKCSWLCVSRVWLVWGRARVIVCECGACHLLLLAVSCRDDVLVQRVTAVCSCLPCLSVGVWL